MSKEILLQKLMAVEQKANASKWSRFIASPINYTTGILFSKFIYPFTKKGWRTNTKTFFNTHFQIILPSGLDIFITSGKSHSSEIRLAKFLIANLKDGDTFIDVGAHYGYFSLLASKLVGSKGKIIAIEPSKISFDILKQNCKNYSCIQLLNKAVSADNGYINFFEMEDMYSEYNTINPSQYQHENWYQPNSAKQNKINAISLDSLTNELKLQPTIIKIDVEGAEDLVITGALNLLQSQSLIVVMEFLSSSRGNMPHIAAHNIFLSNQYISNHIDESGNLKIIDNIEAYLQAHNLDSENIIYVKKHLI